jgi:hypothetical protein
MLFADSTAALEGYRITGDGYLVADVRFARVGIQTYSGLELDRAEMAIVGVYRPVQEVFSAAAMRSFAGRPVTIGHPLDAVSSNTWRQHSVGRMGEEITRDGDFVRGTVIVQDAAAIEMVKNGTRELSAGYQCDVQWEAGKTSDGRAFQAVQRSIRGNHVAIVDRARAGAACRIGVAA